MVRNFFSKSLPIFYEAERNFLTTEASSAAFETFLCTPVKAAGLGLHIRSLPTNLSSRHSALAEPRWRTLKSCSCSQTVSGSLLVPRPADPGVKPTLLNIVWKAFHNLEQLPCRSHRTSSLLQLPSPTCVLNLAPNLCLGSCGSVSLKYCSHHLVHT